MSHVTDVRYQRQQDDRFRALVVAWVGKLPPDGWVGGVSDLTVALYNLAVETKAIYGVNVPTGSALTKAVQLCLPAIEAVGWSVSFKRTKSTRSIVFSRQRAKT